MLDKGLVEKARERAKYYLRQRGMGSRASVFNAIYDLVDSDLPREVLPRVDAILEGFFTGAAFQGNLCGAVIGGLAALGLVHGGTMGMDYKKDGGGWWAKAFGGGPMSQLIKENNKSPREKLQRYIELQSPFAIYNQIPLRFKERFGTLSCLELTSQWADDPINIEFFRNCERIVVETAGMTMEVLVEASEKGIHSFEIGDNMYDRLAAALDGEKGKRG